MKEIDESFGKIEEDPFGDYDISYDYETKESDNSSNKFDYDEYGEINYDDIDDILYWIDNAVNDGIDIDVILNDIPREVYDDIEKLAKILENVGIEHLKKYINPFFFSFKETVYRLANEIWCPDVGYMYELIDDNLKKDREFLLNLVAIDDNYFSCLDNKYLKDKEFILEVYNSRNRDISIKNIIEIKIKVSSALFPYIDDSLKDDIDIVKAAINYSFWEVEYFPEEIKKNKDIIELALNKDVRSYQYLYKYITHLDYIKELYEKYYFDFQYLPEDIKKIYSNDKKRMKEIINNDMANIRYLSDELKHDKEYIKEIIVDSECFQLYFDDTISELFEDYDFLIDIIKSRRDYVYMLPIPEKIQNSNKFKKDMKKLDIPLTYFETDIDGIF